MWAKNSFYAGGSFEYPAPAEGQGFNFEQADREVSVLISQTRGDERYG
jgi:hypothetical protein